MGIIILVGLALGYIVLAFFAAKTWHVAHVVLLVFLFFATVGFTIMAAATLKTHGRYRKDYKTLTASLENELKKKDELLNGRSISEDEENPSLRALEGDVRRSLVDRGRVWRNLTATNLEGMNLSLDASKWGNEQCQKASDDGLDGEIEPVPEGVEGGSGVKPLAINVGAVVFAFKETPVPDTSPELKTLLFGEDSNLVQNGMCKLPTEFLGEFRVTSVADDNSTVGLQAVRPLDGATAESIQNETFTWVLYEKMPLDAHETLVGLTADQLKVLMPPSEGVRPERYDAMISEYSRDQQRAEAADLPERKWVKVRFKKSYDVDVDVPESVPEPNQSFDATGRSQSALLSQSEKTSFSEGDEVTLDFDTATRLQNDGFVEWIEPIFVRRLRDYEQAFGFYQTEIDALDSAIAVARQDLQSLQGTKTSLDGQIAFRTDERSELTHDQDGFQKEQKVITDLHNEMKQLKNSKRKELSQLYRAIRQSASAAAKMVPVSATK